MEWISIVSIFITAVATCVIAWYSKVSSDLAKELKSQEMNFRQGLEDLTKQHHKELSSLYQAITIATLMGGSSNSGVVANLIKTFNQHYKGDIEIFN